MSENTEDQGGTVSEGGSGELNAETALGGADAVPDTPDTNDRGTRSTRASNVPGDEREADGDLGVDGEE